ncbi:hypothetical protein [Exiguobacterium sp. SH0S2]|uniref:hypothetical protein n=1 Tax=Exiguobacterium sp. SH0S2 TaxID=2510950 RepID=UPI0010399D02|nr:hypothetical protein [Exiguobacterium sp. SH0S2]TCI58560.1 hypothetical protein EVJ21_15100 [Exiguobacterium sp. SH0S2]
MSEFVVNKAGAKLYSDVSKHEELQIKESKIYHVLSVGVVGGQRTAIATIKEDDGSAVVYRLPYQLDDWVQSSVVMAHGGLDLFPSDVEFGVIDERIYAEIL